MANQDTLCGWGDKRKITYFMENHDAIIPRRHEQLTMVVELLPVPVERTLSILDLGAGFGALSEKVLERFPRASVTCIDGSSVAIGLAREYLSKHGAKGRIFERDLADSGWREGIGGPFDCAVSALAIHHVNDLRKAALYKEIYEMLLPGGIFINDEIVAAPQALKSHFDAISFRTIRRQDQAKRGHQRTIDEIRTELHEQLRTLSEEHHSSIASLRDQLRWLDDAGFKLVDCYWKYLDFAIFGGVRD
jgi:tRNA (cmo5U34)-methyltransferase